MPLGSNHMTYCILLAHCGQWKFKKVTYIKFYFCVFVWQDKDGLLSASDLVAAFAAHGKSIGSGEAQVD
jgi:hypothetical protein